MENRIKIQDVQPAAWKAMYGLENYLAGTQLTKTQKELIKIRASQINRCAFCINMHTTDALKNGESSQRIFLLDAWQETDKFTDEEKALLHITEEVTLIHRHGLTDAAYTNAKEFFSDEIIAQIIMAVAVINSWNRMAISTRMSVE